MMKYTFNLGDKVFAKLKGYPPWPAKIIATNGRRFDVQFYGTGETGTVKDDGLFYYIKHKKRFMKALKRKDYLDAIKEIESEIRIAGTDGNEVGDVVLQALEERDESQASAKRKRVSVDKVVKKVFVTEDPNSAIEKPLNEDDLTKMDKANDLLKNQVSRSGRKIKVKRFSDDEEDDMEQRQKNIKRSKSLTSMDKKSETDVLDSEKDSEATGNTLTKIVEGSEDTVISEKDGEFNLASDTESVTELHKEYDIGDITVIPREYLQAQLEYAIEVKKNENVYKKKPQESRNVSDRSMVIAKLPSGKLVGVKYKQIENSDSEYDYVMDEEFYANDILNKVNQLESGGIEIDEISNACEINLKCDEADVEDSITNRILAWKEEKFRWFQNELNMIDLDSKIIACLGLDKADPKKALEYLNTLLELNVEKLMLKKHPHIVEVVKRLRKYIGNVKEWNLTEEALEVFENDAKQIRSTAEAVYEKFRDIFQVAPEKPFWDEFNEIQKDFKYKTKNLTENEVYMLWHEPDSLKAFIDRSYEKREKIISKQLEVDENKLDKENSSQAANSENKPEEKEPTM